jgi:hypothetical protein
LILLPASLLTLGLSPGLPTQRAIQQYIYCNISYLRGFYCTMPVLS